MLKKIRRFLALSISLTITLPAQAQTPYQFSFLGSLSSQLNNTMNVCSHHLWPDYNWQDVNVITYEGGERAFIWRGNTGQVTPINAALVIPYVQNKSYTFARIEGKESVLLNLATGDGFPKSIYQILDLILHEGFHHFAQKTWRLSPLKRGTVYPLDAEPRLYRKMLFTRLKDYFLSDAQDKSALAKAAYWKKRWAETAPHEVSNNTDAAEGTAKYIGTLGSILSAQGCQLAESDFLKYAKNYVTHNMGRSVTGQHFTLDGEGYEVGGLSAMILRFHTHSTHSWYQQVMNGTNPLDIVLKDVSPQTDEVPPSDLDVFSQTAQTLNATYAEALGTSLEDIASPNSARIVPSFRSSTGSYAPLAFLLPQKFPHLILEPMGQERHFVFAQNKFTSATGAVFVSGEITPCAGAHHWLEIPLTALSYNKGQLSIEHSSLKGHAPARQVIAADGKTWYCLFEEN